MNYNEIFQSIGLSDTTPMDYSNAEEYAKKFKRCSILTYDYVSYSNNTKDLDSHDQKKHSKPMFSH